MAKEMAGATYQLPLLLLLLLLSILANSLGINVGPINAGVTVGNGGRNIGNGVGGGNRSNPPPSVPRSRNQYRARRSRGWRRYNRMLVREFLGSHNSIRIGFQEPPYAWNQTLAKYARRWVRTRRLDCDGMHSGGPYGENMFWGTGTSWRAADAVKSWADERNYYDRTANSCQPGQTCGHFTQIIWNTTMTIGCSRAECVTGGVVIACNYYPPGNYLGESPFQS